MSTTVTLPGYLRAYLESHPVWAWKLVLDTPLERWPRMSCSKRPDLYGLFEAKGLGSGRFHGKGPHQFFRLCETLGDEAAVELVRAYLRERFGEDPKETTAAATAETYGG